MLDGVSGGMNSPQPVLALAPLLLLLLSCAPSASISLGRAATTLEAAAFSSRDAVAPRNLTVQALTTLPKHGLLGIGTSLVIVLNFTETEGAEFEYDGLTTVFVDTTDCTLNRKSVGNRFYRVAPYLYALKYKVEEGDAYSAKVRGRAARVSVGSVIAVSGVF